MLNIYHEWGFSVPPFQTTALPPSKLGQQLLVGRDKELQQILRRIYTPPKIVTIEGVNGIGKTSLINIAAYQAYQRHLDNEDPQLFIPCKDIFQLRPDQPIEEFIDRVLMSVAQTLLDEAELLKQKDIKTKPIDRWLNAPQLETFNGGLDVFGFGGSFGKNAETNTSNGYTRSGFRKAVLSWLQKIFPTNQDGGVICVIDNLELLQTSKIAKEILEQLRDDLLTIIGIRWVLCGALGIVHGVAGTPRLSGLLYDPLSVEGIDDALAGEIYNSRISAYSMSDGDIYLPLIGEDFNHLHEVLNKNFRDVLSKADDYCQWIADKYPETFPVDPEFKHKLYHQWLNKQSSETWQSVKSQLAPRHWKLIRKAAKLKRPFTMGEYEEFDLNTLQAMSSYVRELENVGVFSITRDDQDGRRKSVELTPKGWLIVYALMNQGVCEKQEYAKSEYEITDKEMEVLVLLQKSMTNQQIADELNLKAGTVRNYLSCIYKKLHTHNRLETLKKALDIGLLAPVHTNEDEIADIHDIMKPDLVSAYFGLTTQELEILQLCSEGMTTKQIAEKLEITDGGVRNYRSSIYDKLKVKNVTEAVMKALELGLLKLKS